MNVANLNKRPEHNPVTGQEVLKFQKHGEWKK